MTPLENFVDAIQAELGRGDRITRLLGELPLMTESQGPDHVLQSRNPQSALLQDQLGDRTPLPIGFDLRSPVVTFWVIAAPGFEQLLENSILTTEEIEGVFDSA